MCLCACASTSCGPLHLAWKAVWIVRAAISQQGPNWSTANQYVDWGLLKIVEARGGLWRATRGCGGLCRVVEICVTRCKFLVSLAVSFSALLFGCDLLSLSTCLAFRATNAKCQHIITAAGECSSSHDSLGWMQLNLH